MASAEVCFKTGSRKGIERISDGMGTDVAKTDAKKKISRLPRVVCQSHIEINNIVPAEAVLGTSSNEITNSNWWSLKSITRERSRGKVRVTLCRIETREGLSDVGPTETSVQSRAPQLE